MPVQLLLLHFRKYQMLLLFWLLLVTTITGNFASHFGASTLFLSPEYMGEVSFTSMLLLGGAMAIFVMGWHITTFIIHSSRVPFMAATRNAYLKYCINNSIIPLAFLVFYSWVSIRFQWYAEHVPIGKIIMLQLGFYLGFLLVLLISFAYFFRVGRDLLKVVVAKITNPSVIREFIPYDTLDYDIDIIKAKTYLSGRFKIARFSDLQQYHPRLLNTVLRRHHRNAITATLFSLILLVVLGIFMDHPRVRIPAGAGFLILFAIMMGLVGAVKYFLRSWEIIGWALLFILFSFFVKWRVFDLRSEAYGINYASDSAPLPPYDYAHLRGVFTPQRYMQDKQQEEARLNRWATLQQDTTAPLIVISVSGGGSRSAYWTFRALQYIDSLTQGALYNNTVLITGASGGMIGAAYWREVQAAYEDGGLTTPYQPAFQENIGKDLLNAVVISFASVDLISPFNNIRVNGYTYDRNRGYALEQELIRNTNGMLGKPLAHYRLPEAEGRMPALIINSSIVNDGRKLMVSAQPIAYLTRPVYALHDSATPPIDAVDYGAFFATQNPYNLRLVSALRMNATFPYVLPVVKLPSVPEMNIMDAGLRDNFGIELASRYLLVMQPWIQAHGKRVIFLELRDTKEYEVFPPTAQSSLAAQLFNPLVVIQNKWEPFQSYTHGYIKDYMQRDTAANLHIITLQYLPRDMENTAALNFHLTQDEKQDLYQSFYHPQNQLAVSNLLKLLTPSITPQ